MCHSKTEKRNIKRFSRSAPDPPTVCRRWDGETGRRPGKCGRWTRSRPRLSITSVTYLHRILLINWPRKDGMLSRPWCGRKKNSQSRDQSPALSQIATIKCFPVLCYGLQARLLRKSQFGCLNCVINSTFRKVFDARSQDVVDIFLEMFNGTIDCCHA